MKFLNAIRKNVKIIRLIMYAFLVIYAVTSLYPLFFTLVSSFKTDQSIFFTPFSLPKTLTFTNYIRAWNLSHLSQYYINSIYLSVISCLILIFVGSMAAYAINKFDFKYSKAVYLFFIMGMMIPAQSTIIPLAFDVGKVHLYNSLPMVIIIISAFQIPITLFIFSGFMSGVPNSLLEAAIIDGSNTFYVYTRIILPLSMPAIVTVTIFNFIASWNNILFPLVFLNTDNVKPIAIGLLAFFGERQSDYSGVMAAIVLTCLPPLLIYILLQEKVEKGLTAGAVKG
jgi:raffinose/stachyose/melibiose transport system permease protein